MSRSGYSDDGENWSLIRWRGAVTSALRGRKGQAFLRETLAALDALPEPELTTSALEENGCYCTLGAVGKSRGTPLNTVESDDNEGVAHLFSIPHALACEIMWENDDGGRYDETPKARWERMRRWVVSNIKGDQ
jgi:hypothetical protein